MEYDNTNRGVLFKNNDKAKETTLITRAVT